MGGSIITRGEGGVPADGSRWGVRTLREPRVPEMTQQDAELCPDDPRGSYMEHQGIGERMYMEARNGVYVLETNVAPKHKQAFPFGGQGR